MAAEGTKNRKQQILEMLAHMLEQPKREKITTASLAAKLDLSEAALYRHFASKAQMFEGLIEFIEQSVFGIVNKITSQQESGMAQLEAIMNVLLGFAATNPGMTRVLIGDALVNENDRLQARINQLHDRLEATLRQSLRIAASQQETQADANITANILLCIVVGRWQQFAKSGFKRSPNADFATLWAGLRAGM